MTAAPVWEAPLAARVRRLTRRFGDHVVINHLDLDIQHGEFVALLGASGCGKSTLLRILADLDHGIDGEVYVADRRAVAFQAPRLMPWKKVWHNVVLGLPGHPTKRGGRGIGGGWDRGAGGRLAEDALGW